jgi:serine/threonine protein kinase
VDDIPHVSKEVNKLIRHMLKENPDDRANINGIFWDYNTIKAEVKRQLSEEEYDLEFSLNNTKGKKKDYTIEKLQRELDLKRGVVVKGKHSKEEDKPKFDKEWLTFTLNQMTSRLEHNQNCLGKDVIDLAIVRDTIIDYSISKENDFDNDLVPYRQISMKDNKGKQIDELNSILKASLLNFDYNIDTSVFMALWEEFKEGS